jgi:hypothetical protein
MENINPIPSAEMDIKLGPTNSGTNKKASLKRKRLKSETSTIEINQRSMQWNRIIGDSRINPWIKVNPNYKKINVEN